MKRSPIRRRLAIATYVSVLAFVIAHATNAFVAAALQSPSEHAVPSVEAGVPVESAPTVEGVHQSAETILRSGLFALPATVRSASDEETTEPPPPPLNAATKVVLHGIVLGQQEGVMAILEDVATKTQSLYRVGSLVPSVGMLAAIEKERVLFREGKTEEWLDLAHATQMRSGSLESHAPTSVRPPLPPQRRVLDRREVTAALNDPTRLLTQAQAVPYLTDGKLNGFRLYNVAPRGLLDTIGLQSNDILQRINGVELRDPGMMLSLLQQLRQERTVRVDLVRNDQRHTLTYEIR